MRYRFLTLLAAALSATPLLAAGTEASQSYQAPAAKLAGSLSSNGMPNVATLYVKYCFAGVAPCHEYQAKVTGQTCDPHLARRAATEHRVDGPVPPGMVYVSWRCVLADPADEGRVATEGTADEWPDMPPMPPWSSSAAGKAVIPPRCHILDDRGRPVSSWWARADDICYSADAPSRVAKSVPASFPANDPADNLSGSTTGAQVRGLPNHDGLLPIAWCQSGTKQWAESGPTCHLDVSKRLAAVCGAERDGVVTTVTGCSIPEQWMRAFRATPADVPGAETDAPDIVQLVTYPQ